MVGLGVGGFGVGGLGLWGAADAPDGMEKIAYNHNMIATFASSTQLQCTLCCRYDHNVATIPGEGGGGGGGGGGIGSVGGAVP